MVITTGATPQTPLNWDLRMPASIGGNEGWFYDLLRKAGISPADSHNVVEFVVRPLEIILVVAIAFVVAFVGARVIRRVVTKMGTPAAQRLSSPRAAARLHTTAAVTANIWRFVVAVTAIAVILGMLGINLTPLLASATVIGATIGFGAQSLVRDYLSGFLLTVEDQYGIGDTISVNDVTGTVEDLSLRVTRVRAADGSLFYLPNGDIRKIANGSRGWAKAVVEVELAVADATDIQRAIDLVTEAATAVRDEAPPAASCTMAPEVLGLVGAQRPGATIRVLLQTNPAHRAEIERSLRMATVGALADAGLWSGPTTP
jgi:moderate conductance mechanosensitive channel